MDTKLNYQQAKQVRERSIKDLIADELIRGKGLGGAISGAVGLRTQARIKGIKEKFDPLNIVKFLTFGSRIGPALYGRLFGRSRKDIEYFTGRASAIGERKKKITGLSGTDEETGGMKEVLNQILTFLQKSHEDDMTLREKENNIRESAKLEDDRRHKELLKALGVDVTVPTATVQKKGGFLDGIMNIINGFRNQIQSLIDDIKNIKNIFKDISILRNLIWLAGVATSPIALVVALIGYGLFSMWEKNKKIAALAAQGDVEGLRTYLTKSQSEEEAVATGGGIADVNEIKMELKKAAEGGSVKAQEALDKLNKEQEATKKPKDYFDEYMATKGYYAGMRYKNFQGQKAPQAIIDDANKFASEKTGQTVNIKPEFERIINQPQAPEGQQFDVEGNLIDLPKPKPVPPPVNGPPASQKLNDVVGENVSLNVLESTQRTAVQDANVNKIINTPNKGQYKKIPMPPVRNLEESFQRMIMNSTRLV